MNNKKEYERSTLTDKITQTLIDSGKTAIDISSPLSACKLVLENIEQRNQDRFIENVLSELKNVDAKSLDLYKSLKRLYFSVQVINKVITEEKRKRLLRLTVNGIINQSKIQDDIYELYVNIINELTDTEFLLLLKIDEIEKQHENETMNIQTENKIGEQLINELRLSKDTFDSYIARLKSKGLILDLGGGFINYKSPFFSTFIHGNISLLFKELHNFIED